MFLSPGSRAHLRTPSLFGAGMFFNRSPSITRSFTGSGSPALYCITTESAGPQTGAVNALSGSVPEIVAQFSLSSSVGSANKTTAYKIGFTSSVVGTVNSANIYGANIITQGFGGSGQYLVTGLEVDVNNVGTDASSTLTTNGAANVYHIVATGLGSGKTTAHYWSVGLSAGSAPFYSYAASGFAGDSSFLDDTTASNIMRAAGSHTHANGINLFSGIFSGGDGVAFISPNNIGFGSANAAGNATILVAKLDGSNIIQYGSTSVIRHQFNVNPGGGTAAMSVINSHATATDIILQLQGGTPTAVDATTAYCNFVNPANTIQRGSIVANDAGAVGAVKYNISSDARLKRSLGLLDDAIERLMKIKVHRYVGADYDGDGFNVGFFAQNLFMAFPWAVTPSTDPDFQLHPWQVDYGRVTPLLVASVQDQEQRIRKLEESR